MRKFYFIVCVLCFAAITKSQTVIICDSTATAKEGSFEIVKKINASEVINSEKEALTCETLCMIEKSRKETDKVILDFTNYTIIIYPRKK